VDNFTGSPHNPGDRGRFFLGNVIKDGALLTGHYEQAKQEDAKHWEQPGRLPGLPAEGNGVRYCGFVVNEGQFHIFILP
jgi:hypothetical protein